MGNMITFRRFVDDISCIDEPRVHETYALRTLDKSFGSGGSGGGGVFLHRSHPPPPRSCAVYSSSRHVNICIAHKHEIVCTI